MRATLEMEDMDMNLDRVLEREPSPVPHRQRADRDLDLLKALRLHDPAAAERLVTTYGERAYRLASNITGSEQDAEEVVQDAFWTVANAAYQKLRGRRRRGQDLSLDEGLPSFDAWDGHVSPMADWSARVDDPSI
jgi:hypothetical protein